MKHAMCELHGETFVVYPDGQACPFCVQIERYERLKKQYEQVRDELEVAPGTGP